VVCCNFLGEFEDDQKKKKDDPILIVSRGSQINLPRRIGSEHRIIFYGTLIPRLTNKRNALSTLLELGHFCIRVISIFWKKPAPVATILSWVFMTMKRDWMLEVGLGRSKRDIFDFNYETRPDAGRGVREK
jgi:hypothetical protein